MEHPTSVNTFFSLTSLTRLAGLIRDADTTSSASSSTGALDGSGRPATSGASSSEGDDAFLREHFDLLHRALQEAVPSYAGCRLTTYQDGYPIVVTSSPPRGSAATPSAGSNSWGPVVTSLRVPLTVPVPGEQADAGPGSRIVFYARAPGALVDLAADLAYSLAGPASEESPSSRPGPSSRPVGRGGVGRGGVALDADVPACLPADGVSGLGELSTISRATGVLIERGHPLENVHDDLRHAAAAGGLTPHAYATRLLLEQWPE